MTNDPAISPTTIPMSLDPIQPRSIAEFATDSQTTPQRAATSLDVARHHAYTGEITFLVEPLVRVYLDGGVVYYAEVVGGQTIGELLLAAGVVSPGQLEQGVVRVGDVEHLGRLFDRDATVDRDAAMVVVEHHVDQLVNQLAERVVSSISISAYRHHASGVHRWFVAPIDAAETPRPVSEVAQVDRSVVDELPALEPRSSEVRIEWTEPLPSDTSQASSADVQAEVDSFDADVADWAAAAPTAEAAPDPVEAITLNTTDPIADESAINPINDFHIVWPDGTEDATLIPDAVADDPPAIALDLTPAVVEEIPDPDGAIPDDVAAAVKRALQAIDEASAQPIVIPEMVLSPILLPQIDTVAPLPVDVPPIAAPTPELELEIAPGPQPMGFAPPTASMSAEAIYERQAAELAAQRGAAQIITTPLAAETVDPAATDLVDPLVTVVVDPAETVVADPAVTVVVDDAATGVGAPRLPGPQAAEPAVDPNERRGALRRLIGNLRKHDND